MPPAREHCHNKPPAPLTSLPYAIPLLPKPKPAQRLSQPSSSNQAARPSICLASEHWLSYAISEQQKNFFTFFHLPVDTFCQVSRMQGVEGMSLPTSESPPPPSERPDRVAEASWLSTDNREAQGHLIC